MFEFLHRWLYYAVYAVILCLLFCSSIRLQSRWALVTGVQTCALPISMRQSTFDLILMDIQMPELDGILTTKVIRSADASWSRIPIIALTAHAIGRASCRERVCQYV